MRLLLLLLPLYALANSFDRDGDGWSDAEELAKGFRPDNPLSHPPAPRYAPADLGSVNEHGWPIALSDERHRVLTDRGFRWSWDDGWQRLALPPRSENVEYAAIRSDGAVLARVESSDDGLPTTSVWRWDDIESPYLVPGTLHRYIPDDEPAPWFIRPLRWLRGEGFLATAEPIVLEPEPTGVDVLIGDARIGLPVPRRRFLSPLVVGNGIGERWVASFDSPPGSWRLDGTNRSLGSDTEPLAWSDDGALLVRRAGQLQLEETGSTPWRLPFSGAVSRVALADAHGALRSIVSLASREPLVWDVDAPDRDIRAPELLTHLIETTEGWTELHPVAMDAAGAILAVGRRHGSSLRIVLLVPFRLRADLARATDGVGLRADFPLGDEGFPAEHRPLRLWLNDDRDQGFLSIDPLSDLPGQSADHRSNLHQTTVGGTSDLVDWFPVALRLGASAEDLPPYDIRLLGPAHLVNAIETSLPVARAAQYLQRDLGAAHGPFLGEPLGAATKSRAQTGGLLLSSVFSRSTVGPRLLGLGEGVILLEGAQSGSGTLWVALVRKGLPVGRVPEPADILLRAPLRVAVGPVDAFHRSWDARSRSAQTVPAPAMLPDKEATGPWVIFIHGFNVGPDQGRAWGAEIFKRLHQAGSAGRYVAFRWYGDHGAVNYAAAVECAPAAAARLRQQMADLAKQDPGRPFVLMGHSLGGYVALLAAEPASLPKGVTLSACLLINAAVPSESLDPGAAFRTADYAEGAGHPNAFLMTPPSSVWRGSAPYANTDYQASRWAALFPADDHRSGCRWVGRFPSDIPLVNLYSRSEDVLSPPPADEARWPGLLAVADHGAWIYQEATKGLWPGKWVNPSRAQAGWGLSPQASRRASDLTRANEAERLRLLRARPLFADPREKSLLQPNVGRNTPGSRAANRRLTSLRGIGSARLPSGSHWTVRDELLAHAIPALSPAAGSVPLAGIRNYRMDGAGPSDPHPGELAPFPLGWPRGIEVTAYLNAPAPIWRHSDWKNVAYPYVHPVYATLIREAKLGTSSIPQP